MCLSAAGCPRWLCGSKWFHSGSHEHHQTVVQFCDQIHCTVKGGIDTGLELESISLAVEIWESPWSPLLYSTGVSCWKSDRLLTEQTRHTAITPIFGHSGAFLQSAVSALFESAAELACVHMYNAGSQRDMGQTNFPALANGHAKPKSRRKGKGENGISTDPSILDTNNSIPDTHGLTPTNGSETVVWTYAAKEMLLQDFLVIFCLKATVTTGVGLDQWVLRQLV